MFDQCFCLAPCLRMHWDLSNVEPKMDRIGLSYIMVDRTRYKPGTLCLMNVILSTLTKSCVVRNGAQTRHSTSQPELIKSQKR